MATLPGFPILVDVLASYQPIKVSGPANIQQWLDICLFQSAIQIVLWIGGYVPWS